MAKVPLRLAAVTGAGPVMEPVDTTMALPEVEVFAALWAVIEV